MSELILMILAFAAQMEVQAIQERTQGASAYLRSVGRWKGGRIPFGRMPVPHPEEDEGWWLGRHDDTASIIDDMVRFVLDGEKPQSYHAIAAWLNSKHPGVTPANHRRLLATPPKKTDPKARWNPGMVSSLLRQPSLRGWLMLGSDPVRDDKGEPVKMGPALVDDVTWRRLQAAMDGRDTTSSQNKSDAHPLLGVLFCGSCDGKLYQGWIAAGPHAKVAKRQYRCAAKAHGRECRKPAYVTADPVDAYAEEEFLARFGRFELIEVITIPGIDHRDEIKELQADVANLAKQLAKLRDAAADAVASQLQGRSDKLKRLEAQPIVPPRTEEIRTGVTYADAWERAKDDTQVRRKMLLDVGLRVSVGETYRGARDVRKRLSASVVTPEHVDLAQDALDDVAAQEAL
jgi:hypothetical protein